MTSTNLVRPSRDGDQFHYLWAARRCLLLLHPKTDLVAITIEGTSPTETAAEAPQEGEDVIDIAEYHGDQSLASATRVVYRQLKHSTLHAEKAWTASGLEKTITGFSDKYKSLLKDFSIEDVKGRFGFHFVTNRPVSSDVIETISDAAATVIARHPNELKKLERFTGLAGAELSAFCQLLHMEEKQEPLWEQRNILYRDLSGYLPDADVDAPTQLKELVTGKALSAAAANPAITKIDVLRVLKTDESRLYPAPPLVTLPSDYVPREQEQALLTAIVAAGNTPVIVHALGGVGKSVFAARIRAGLPAGSKAVLYDCFGNGTYRSATGYRHRHQDALVQISNELASESLCHPLIPTPNADATGYLKAFLHRLQQASVLLRAQDANAVLCIVIDAADNAQMAAEELGQTRSFVRDLIRLPIPEGVRLVMLCRSHRRSFLDPPSGTICRELLPFSRTETATYLRTRFPDSSEHDVGEFHRLTSQNPRVQALALSQGLPLQDTLRLLGPNPTTVESAIGDLLAKAISKLRDSEGPIEKSRIDRICSGLAALRPLIPIPILAQMSGVPQEAIRSFALDLGRPLLVTGDSIQFLDEPVETWFREQYKPSPAAMTDFISILTPLASKSAYVASTLPQLMLEAGKFTELVTLALQSQALPDGSPLERRDVELQRLQFALKASLRSKRYLDAVKLSLKAGGETAGDDRQRKTIQANTDLSTRFLSLDLIQELVSRRSFGSQWVGSHHAYEAGLLSGREELAGDARSRLRMAGEWLRNWSQLSDEERRKESVSVEDIAELGLAHLNVHGVATAIAQIAGWKPPEITFRVGRMVASRLIDHGRQQDLSEIATAAADRNLCLSLAIVSELSEIHQAPPEAATRQIFTQVVGLRRKLKYGQWDGEGVVLDTIVSLVEAGLKTNVCTREAAADLLKRYLPKEPPRGLASRFSSIAGPYLRAYCLHAALSGQTLQLIDLAHADLRKELEKENRHHTSQDAQEFNEQIGTLLPWHQLRAGAVIDGTAKDVLLPKLDLLSQKLGKESESYYRNDTRVPDDIAVIWFELLIRLDVTDDGAVANLKNWADQRKRPLFTSTFSSIARLASHTAQTRALALEFAAKAFKLTQDERSDADNKSSSYVSIARSILFASPDEAKGYFNEAIAVASKIGDENLARWDAILDLAEHAARADRPVPEVAYRFSRCAEVTYDYVPRDKHFDWSATVKSLAALCPNSCFAIMSRWRDRRFGRLSRILPIAISHLTTLGHLDGRDAIPLVAIEAEWEHAELLDAALKACANAKEKQSYAEWLHRYTRLLKLSSAHLNGLQQTLTQHKIAIEQLDTPISSANASEKLKERRQAEDEYDRPASAPFQSTDWNAIFDGQDVSTSDGLAKAYNAFRSSPTPRLADNFFAEVFRRVAPGREAAMIEAASQVPAFSLYELRNLLQQLPVPIRGRPAVVQSLALTLKAFCRRFCMGITKNRHYEVLPLRMACELAGVKESEAAEVVLDAIGESGDLPNSGRLFSLAALLALQLTKDDALEGLQYGLSLFDAVLEDKDGDGPWRVELSPPAELNQSIAQYVYAGLAMPAARDRWAYAHAVWGYCALGRTPIVAHLVGASSKSISPVFVDATLPFYSLHAIQWLLFAFARVALEHPQVLAAHAAQFVQWALATQNHALIRELAARTSLALASSTAAIDANDFSKLRTVNRSRITPLVSKSYRRVEGEAKASHSADTAEEDKFYFGIDFGPHWLAPLGRVFALSQRRMETEAVKVVRDELAYSGKAAWDEDPRQTKKLYGRNETFARHSSYADADTHQFYLWYHSMMITAGKLLEALPTHVDPDNEKSDEFADWLKRHDITRLDRRWLFDRRDPTPNDAPSWRELKLGDPVWLTASSQESLDAWHSTDRLCVWGYWTNDDSSRRETLTVRSALVSPETSMSLLRALGSASSTHSYQIPSAEHEEEIENGPFVLKGWISDHTIDREMDAKDPWSGDVRFPAPAPSATIAEQFLLKPDSDERTWTDATGAKVMSSIVWGSPPADEEEQERPEGRRLFASTAFVQSMLERLERDLIVLVHIERRRQYRRHEGRSENDEERSNNTRIYLFRRDGSHSTG